MERTIASITGNADDETKRAFLVIGDTFARRPSGKPSFGESILHRLRVVHASVDPKLEEPLKKEGKIVVEVEMADDMLNGGGNLHGGAAAFLIDVCSTMSLMLLDGGLTVSQSLNVVYHSPAGLGDTLRLVNTTMTVGARAVSARTEIWNKTKNRLVASGVHIKMQPSPAKL